MSDRLLRELGEMVRSETQDDKARFGDRWDHLAAGTLTAEEEAELKALADSSPEDHEAYEAFRPLGADFQARVVSAINAERAGPATAAPRPEPQEPHPRVLPFRRIVRRAEVWVGLAAAMAAGVFFLVRTPELPPLPHSTVEVFGGDKTTRGNDSSPTSGPPVFSHGSILELRVHPSLQSSRDLELKAFRVRAGREEDPWVLISGFNVEKGANGFIRLRGKVGEQIPLPVGLWRICVVVSRPGKSPQERTLPAALRERHADWQADCAEPLQVRDST